MDIDKLQLERKRDQIWALAREDMPLIEKFFNEKTSESEATQVAVISIELIATELYVYFFIFFSFLAKYLLANLRLDGDFRCLACYIYI